MTTDHLPEHTYLMAERGAELTEARIGDGRELWSSEDNVLLYSADDLQFSQEYEGEYIADEGPITSTGTAPNAAM